MGWHARLQLNYRRDGERCIAHDRHEGPLRVLRSLYPQGPGICHNVLVHPPGGVVGGDVLALDVDVGTACHALITTPGATRFYRSASALAQQQVDVQIGAGARLEWLPLETIAYSACQVSNRLRFELAASAEMIGWDVLALGLPSAGQPFAQGRFVQHLELPGAWLERGAVDAADKRLLDSPLGWAGKRVLATLWFAGGENLPPARGEALVDVAREQVAAWPALAACVGVSFINPRVVVLRALAERVEPAMQLLAQVWAAWRALAWQLDAPTPRIWNT